MGVKRYRRRDLIHQRFVDGGIEVGRLAFPVFIDILRRLFVGHDEFQLQHGLHERKDFQVHGVGAVHVLEVVGLAFLSVTKLAAVVLDVRGNFVADTLGNVDIEIIEALSALARDDVEGVVVLAGNVAKEPVFQKTGKQFFAVDIMQPVVDRRTHFEQRSLGQSRFHFIEHKKYDQFIDGRLALNLHLYAPKIYRGQNFILYYT